MGAKQKAKEPKVPRIPIAADPARLTVGASRVLASMGGAGHV